MPFRNENEVFQWILWADNEYLAAKDDMDKAREYYENYQAPDNVPKDVSYVIRNLIVDYVDRQVSKLVGAKVDVSLPGAGEMGEVLSLLLGDFKEKNKFHEFLLEKHANNLHVEGIAYWKVAFNPFRLGPYGLGFPEIFSLKPEEGRLDPNAVSPYHEDDNARSHVKFINVTEAKARWPEFKDRIGAYGGQNDQLQSKTAANLQMARLDEVEFRREYQVPARFNPVLNKYIPIQLLDDQIIPEGQSEPDFVGAIKEFDPDKLPEDVVVIEAEEFFVCKVINLNLLVEKPQKSDFSGFSIIPTLAAVHSGRRHKYPQSRVTYLKDTQDRINTTSSVALEVSKRSLKNPVFLEGASKDDVTEVQRKIAGVGKIIAIRKPGAKVVPVPGPSMPPHLLQQLQLDLQTFEDIGNTSNPDRGQNIEGSGRKVIALQSRTDLPQFVIQTHLKSSLTELFRRLIEIIPKLNHQFSISAQRQGEEEMVMFNAPQAMAGGDEKLNIVVDGKLNPLEMVEVPNVKIDIDLNSLAREEININKAMTMFQQQALAMVDLHKAVYPNKWKETLKHVQEQNEALKLVAEIENLRPEAKQLLEEYLTSLKLSQELVQAADKMPQQGNGTLKPQGS